jgi:hypothetical protein
MNVYLINFAGCGEGPFRGNKIEGVSITESMDAKFVERNIF